MVAASVTLAAGVEMAKESSHVVAFSKSHLKSGETVVAWGDGYIGEMMGQGKNKQHNGSLIVSGERVAFYRKGFFGEVLETMPLKSITSIERKSLLGHRTIRIHTSHDALEFKFFDKAVEEQLVTAIEAGRSAPGVASSPGPVVAGAGTSDHLETLRKLGELRQAGVLTEAEFAEKKAALLAKL